MDWKKIVKTVAPALGTALLGPMGGVATKYIADTFLGKTDATEQEVQAAITNASPEQLLKLKQLDADFSTKMAQVGVDIYKLDVEDRESARQRQAAMKDWTPTVLAILIIIIFCVELFVIGRNGEITNTEQTLIMILSNMVTIVLSYYFGSSKGSDLKDMLVKR